jgi:TPR repeat protein
MAMMLTACGARGSKGTGSEVSSAAPIRREAVLGHDDGGVRLCTHDAKDVTPCIEDCDRGIVSACTLVADRIERGDGVTLDLTRALGFRERACELRDAGSCVTAARMFAAGRGVPPSRARQMDLLAAACALGDAAACSVPAKAFATGAGVARDARRAEQLWEHACTGGVDSACEALGDAGP